MRTSGWDIFVSLASGRVGISVTTVELVVETVVVGWRGDAVTLPRLVGRWRVASVVGDVTIRVVGAAIVSIVVAYKQ